MIVVNQSFLMSKKMGMPANLIWSIDIIFYNVSNYRTVPYKYV